MLTAIRSGNLHMVLKANLGGRSIMRNQFQGEVVIIYAISNLYTGKRIERKGISIRIRNKGILLLHT